MNKYIQKSWTWAISIITFMFMFIPDDLFSTYLLFPKISESMNIAINRMNLFIIIVILSYAINGVFFLFKRSVKIKGQNYTIVVKYGDIFNQKQCKKVIPFDECFSTNVGSAPYDIKPNSICGQYLRDNPLVDIQDLISTTKLESKGKSKYESKESYESGKLLPNGEFLLMSFAKLDKDGLGRMTRDEYIDCLTLLWKEIDKYYGQEDVCIPILGSGITRIGDTTITQQELLDIILYSYKLSLVKIQNPNKLYIICKRRDDFSLNKLESD